MSYIHNGKVVGDKEAGEHYAIQRNKMGWVFRTFANNRLDKDRAIITLKIPFSPKYPKEFNFEKEVDSKNNKIIIGGHRFYHYAVKKWREAEEAAMTPAPVQPGVKVETPNPTVKKIKKDYRKQNGVHYDHAAYERWIEAFTRKESEQPILDDTSFRKFVSELFPCSRVEGIGPANNYAYTVWVGAVPTVECKNPPAYWKGTNLQEAALIFLNNIELGKSGIPISNEGESPMLTVGKKVNEEKPYVEKVGQNVEIILPVKETPMAALKRLRKKLEDNLSEIIVKYCEESGVDLVELILLRDPEKKTFFIDEEETVEERFID